MTKCPSRLSLIRKSGISGWRLRKSGRGTSEGSCHPASLRGAAPGWDTCGWLGSDSTLAGGPGGTSKLGVGPAIGVGSATAVPHSASTHVIETRIRPVCPRGWPGIESAYAFTLGLFEFITDPNPELYRRGSKQRDTAPPAAFSQNWMDGRRDRLRIAERRICGDENSRRERHLGTLRVMAACLGTALAEALLRR